VGVNEFPGGASPHVPHNNLSLLFFDFFVNYLFLGFLQDSCFSNSVVLFLFGFIAKHILRWFLCEFAVEMA